MVQLNTIIRQRINIDPATVGGCSNRARWSECVRNLCRHFLANHLWLQQCSEVELINVTNTLKDGLELNLLDLSDPDLARAFGPIVSSIGQQSFASPASLTALSNCANFLRCLFEHHRLGDPDGPAGQAVHHLLGKIGQLDQHPDRHRSHAQALVNLASFLKAADRWLAGQSRTAAAPYWAMLAQASACLVSALHTLGTADARWLAQPQHGSALLSALQHLAQRGLLDGSQHERVQALVVHLLEAIPGWQIKPHLGPSLLQSLRALMALVQRPVLPAALTAVPAFGPALAYLLDQLQQRLPVPMTEDERLACLQAVQVSTTLGDPSIDRCQPLLQRLLKTTERVDLARLEQALRQAGEPVEPVDVLSAQLLAPPLAAGAATAEKPATVRGPTYWAKAPQPAASAAPAPSRSPVMTAQDDWLTPRHAAKPGAVTPTGIAVSPPLLVSESTTMPTLKSRPAAKQNERGTRSEKPEPKPATPAPAMSATGRKDKAGLPLAQARQDWFTLVTTGNAKTLPKLQELVAAYPELLNQKSAGKKGQSALFQALTQGRKEIVAWLLSQPNLVMPTDLGAFLQEVLGQIGIVETRHVPGIRALVQFAVQQFDQQIIDAHAVTFPQAPPLSKKAIQERRASLFSDAQKQVLSTIPKLQPLFEEHKLMLPHSAVTADKPDMASPAIRSVRLASDKGGKSTDQSFHALREAAIAGDTEQVIAALKSVNNADALAERRDSEGMTALMYAAGAGHTAIVTAILDAVKDPDSLMSVQNDEGMTALMYVAHNGNSEIVKLILNAVNDKDTLARMQDKEGVTALIFAAYSGNNETVGAILSAVSNKDALAKLQDIYGVSALMNAAYRGDAEMVETILQAVDHKDALALLRNKYGTTALINAAHIGNANTLKSILKFVTAKDSLIKLQDVQGATALMRALYGGHSESALTILNACEEPGALTWLTDSQGSTALVHAAHAGDIASATLILDLTKSADAYVLLGDIHGATPLMHAALGGHTEIVQKIFDVAGNNQFLPFIKDNHGQTALARAASKGHTETVRAILKNVERKYDLIYMCEDTGKTAEMLAAEAGYEETAEVIREVLRAGE